jgi:hypothetical protein
MRMSRLFVVGISTATLLLCSWTGAEARQHHSQPLIDAVRAAIPAEFTSIPADATAIGDYGKFAGCVSGPQEGAMGVHYVNGAYVGDGLIDVQRPEALVYEPRDGHLELVAVEFIVIASAWDAANAGPPALMGQVFQFNGTPNRYRLPAFYELHVWMGKPNPSGAFADWNPHVSCDSYGTGQ